MGVWGLYPQRDPWGIAPWRESGGKALWKLALCENEINIVLQVDGTKNTKVQTKRLIFFFFNFLCIYLFLSWERDMAN